MYLTQRQRPRHTVLRGLGAAPALPFLGAMVTAGRAETRRRLGLLCLE